MNQHPDKFGAILKNPNETRVQILYTQINRDKKNRPFFKTYSYRLNADEYFYPASTVKFPACILALEKLNHLNINNLTAITPMLTDSCPGIPNYPPQLSDDTKADKMPTIAHYIKKILLVSDNDAFNRLYEFIGQEAFNDSLHHKGYKNVRITHRLAISMTSEQNSLSNPIRFEDKGAVVYQQPRLRSTKQYAPPAPIKLGKGYVSGGKVINEPFDFTYRNYFALDAQQAILKAVLFPEAVPARQRFRLTEDDYTFLYKYMSMSPMESDEPIYRTDTAMYDSYCKFFMFGDDKKPMPKTIRIFNKVGDAYGFLLDNAYIVDFENGVEFMLTAVIYCNADGIFNDDKYEYDSIGFPFLGNLGRVLYDYEKKRKKRVRPDLSKFVVDYRK